MNKKDGILKLLTAVICLFSVIIFALTASGNTPGFVVKCGDGIRTGINAVAGALHIQKSGENTKEDGEAEQEAEDAEETEITEGPVREKPVNARDLPTAFAIAENTLFSRCKKDIVCANATLYAKYSHDASLEWIESIQMQEPVLAVKGDYVLISETGAKKISLYRGKRLVYTVETEGNIYTADLSENGDVIAVTEKEYFKGQVVVFNRRGKRIFAWNSGSYSILDAAVSKGRRIGISLLSTDEGAGSIIEMFDANGKELFKTDIFSDTVFFNTDFNGENLTLLSENRYVCLNKKGGIKWEYDYGGKRIIKSCRDQKGNRAILSENEGIGEITVITARGKVYPPIKTNSMPDAIDIDSGRVAYNNGRTVYITGYNGKSVISAEGAADIRRVYITGQDRAFCVYSTAVQEKRLKK